jgi:uncharacterized protein (DUF1501 family)
MDRRDFMKLAGATGLVLASPLPSRDANAQEGARPYDGPLFVFVGANGGWDPTFFCDPKGFMSEEEDNPMNRTYANADIGTVGNLPFAPVGGYPEFVERHYQKMMVINGIDTKTNGHDSGRRVVASGKLNDGFPAFGALVAAEYGAGMPMGFITNGFYDATSGTTARTRVGNLAAFERIARPNTIQNDRLFHTEETMARIQEAQQSRLLAMKQQAKLPKEQQTMSTLHMARGSDNVLSRLLDTLPDERPNGGLERQAQLAIAAYKAGACVSATLSTGGFDTHGNHDQSHLPRLNNIWAGVNYLWEEAERQGVADKVVVIIGSDFGRTPRYNSNNGKDHWSVTSMILMGNGIPGNTLIGETTHEHRLRTVDPSSLRVDDAGIRIEPGHVHWALRKLAKIENSPLHAQFPLDVKEYLPLFGS